MNLEKIDLFPLYNILMPKKSVCSEQELYFRTKSGSSVQYCEEKGAVSFGKSDTVSFDTYFNSFAIGKYRKYCNFSSVYLALEISGNFIVQVFSVSKNNNTFEEKCILEKEINTGGIVQKVQLTEINPDDGSAQIYFTLTAKSDCIFSGGEFGCQTDKINDINLGIVICTYKREKYLKKNLASINEYLGGNRTFDNKNIHFYIVDNGQTLNSNDIENKYISLFYNRNTGGSGGFKRGYVEAVHSGKNHTHILFMDDDVVLDCEMFFRVFMLLSFAKKEWSELSVGGTMLKLRNPCIEHEAGAVWDGKRIQNIGKNLDMTKRENVFEVSYFPKGNYNAWWFYCFPADWHEKYGYPLQFFVKTDDIEYSVRCATEIAILNGIAVWHEDFESKYDGFVEYYIKRNELIFSSVNNCKPYTFFQVRKLAASVARQIVYQRYFLADLIFKAYDDYLLGYKHFLDVDTEKLNTELMSLCKPFLSDDELKEKYGVYFDSEKYEKSLTEINDTKKQALTLNGYLIPSCFYHKDKDGFAITDAAKCRFVNFYKHKKVLHYDLVGQRGFVTVQKRTKLLKYGFMLVGKSIKFIIKYPKVRKGFKEHLSDMSKEQV